ncbi:MAG TPA: hypothetical protein DEF59_00550 [Candidatus Magasanikbacteria bacterium]|nr:hypothetical protein [Candidatus Magasanikbacteria bacterium]
MIHRFFQWGVVAIWFLCALLIKTFPGSLWWWIVSGVIIDGVFVVLYAKRIHDFSWSFYFPWILGAYASLFLFMFLDRPLLRDVWFVSVTICSVLYWYRLEKWAHAPSEQETRVCALAAFWLALGLAAGGITLYAWQIFVGQSAWILAFWVFMLIGTTTITMLKLKYKNSAPEFFLHSAVLMLIAFELFWVVGFTTLGFASKGYLWASGVWYSWWLFILIQQKNIKTTHVLKGTGILFLSWSIVFFFTRWF